MAKKQEQNNIPIPPALDAKYLEQLNESIRTLNSRLHTTAANKALSVQEYVKFPVGKTRDFLINEQIEGRITIVSCFIRAEFKEPLLYIKALWYKTYFEEHYLLTESEFEQLFLNNKNYKFTTEWYYIR